LRSRIAEFLEENGENLSLQQSLRLGSE